LVQSVLASVLFDSGASHSFISSHFVKTYDIATVALKRPLLTKSLGGYIHCRVGVIKIPLNLSGVVFVANLVVLNSHGIGVILVMDWLAKCKGSLACVSVLPPAHRGVYPWW
jgi:hypothetical protein